jgi:hypothetical protein
MLVSINMVFTSCRAGEEAIPEQWASTQIRKPLNTHGKRSWGVRRCGEEEVGFGRQVEIGAAGRSQAWATFASWFSPSLSGLKTNLSCTQSFRREAPNPRPHKLSPFPASPSPGSLSSV